MRSSVSLLVNGTALAGVLLLASGVAHSATLALYTFSGNSPASSDTDPDSAASELTGSFGNYPSIAAFGNPAPGWVMSFPVSSAYCCHQGNFTLTPGAAIELALDTLSFDASQRPLPPNSGSFGGQVYYDLRSSLDGFASPIGSEAWNLSNVNPEWASFSVDLSQSAFQNLTAQNLTGGAITFRLSIGATAGGTAEGIFQYIDNITLTGTATPVPGPAGLVLLGTAFAALGLRVRRQSDRPCDRGVCLPV